MRLMSVDVECVATGTGHNDRSPAWIALIDANLNEVFNEKIFVGNVYDCLTYVSGIHDGELDNARPFDDVVKDLKVHLGPDVVLVGQCAKTDIKWLGLRKNVDFKYFVDIAKLFSSVHPIYRTVTYHSLKHEVNTLLWERQYNDPHDPAKDACNSIKLYLLWMNSSKKKRKSMQKKLILTKSEPSMTKLMGYQYRGICLAKFMKHLCTCGQA